MTSNLSRVTEPGNVLLNPGEGSLEKQSVIVVSQVVCLYKARLGARIGSLSRSRVEQILAGMRFQQASFFSQRGTPNNSAAGGEAEPNNAKRM